MLENFTKKQTGRGLLLWKILGISLFLHGIFIMAIILFDSLRVDAVPQPPLAITFVDYASLPPPPPPPPPPKKRSLPKQEQKVQQIKPQTKSVELVAPKNIPQEEHREPETSPDNGVEDGVEGGVPGGVVGGVIGGAMNAPPPPPPPPLQPTYQTPDIIKKRRIAGKDPEYPRIASLAGLECVIKVKIYINPEGEVGEIQFIKSDPHFDQTVRDAIKTWKFTPQVINGTPAGTYTIFTFRFKLE